VDKLTERVLMRVTPDMRREVEALAHFEGRPVNHQYRHLITIGLEQTRGFGRNGIRRSVRQPLSTASELSETFVNRAIPPQRARRAG
jgi:hypothetical protein